MVGLRRCRALLIAGLVAARVKSREPEIAIVHAWLDNWKGIGLIVVGMARHGYDVWLTRDETLRGRRSIIGATSCT